MQSHKPKKRKRTPAQRAAHSQAWMRGLGIAGALPVGAASLYVSYGHMRDLIISAGESGLTPYVLPMAVDGMMLTSAVSILANRGTKIPYVAFGVGVAASLAANVASAQGGDPVALIVAGMPALLLVLTAEVLLRLIVPVARRRKRRTTKVPAHSRLFAWLRGSQPQPKVVTA